MLLLVGYTHANWTKADTIIYNVTSYDFTSSYPYVMTTHKFPATEFRKIKVKKIEQMRSEFAYIIYVKFKNIRCKYWNNFISQNKCKRLLRGKYDNGRMIGAEELEIVLTDIDFRFIFNAYEFDEYEILECYYSIYDYLPKQFINFILDKYVAKTEYKNVEGKEVEYALEKAKFNSLYGMAVTNNIKDAVVYSNEEGWKEIPIDNEEILNMLEKERKQGFLSFSYGVWVTAWARYNLLSNLIKLDNSVIYADTDSLKLTPDYNVKIIDEYNNSVIERIKKVSDELEIDINKFAPKDYKGISHMLGLFENETAKGCKYTYDAFITQGAKKYAYIDASDKQIHITVSGVPKKGAKALKKLEDFKDDFVFNYEDTGKNLLIYNDEMEEFELEDYQGNKEKLNPKYGCTIVPTTYVLGKSEEYADLISDESSKRAIFKEV